MSPKPIPEHVDFARAHEMARIIEAASQTRLFRTNCLRRSLTLWWVLRWQSIPCVIRFGFNKDTRHAWVEHHQRVINDLPNIASHYAILSVDEMDPEKIVSLLQITKH